MYPTLGVLGFLPHSATPSVGLLEIHFLFHSYFPIYISSVLFIIKFNQRHGQVMEKSEPNPFAIPF